MEIKIKKFCENARLPERATSGSAGMDLYACVDEPVTINPGDLKSIGTGIAISLPNSGYGAFIFARSGLATKHGVTLSNAVGVVDSDYRGEIKVGLCNVGSESYTIEPLERIAQLVILPVCIPEVLVTDVLDETARGDGGFGSTGR